MVEVKQYNGQISRWLWGKVILSALLLRPRSFTADARDAVSAIDPPPVYTGLANIPQHEACLVVCNHYTREGLSAWWGPLLINSTIASQRGANADKEIHWVITAAWTFPESPVRKVMLTPLTRWAFDRIARIYGFITMPPMPPAPEDVVERAISVRRTLRLARDIAPHGGMVGLAPEGRDTPEVVGSVPEGVGTFVAHLTRTGFQVLPVAISETDNHLRVSFGQLFQPIIPATRALRDHVVSQQIMSAIDALVNERAP